MEIIAGYKSAKQNTALLKIFSEGFPGNTEITQGLENLLNKNPAKRRYVTSVFFIYPNPCLGMEKSFSWAVTKCRVEVGWVVTKYQVRSRCGVVS